MSTHTAPTDTRLLTSGFTAWLGAALVADVGGGVLYFAIGWTASGLGGHVAGLLLTLAVLPRTALLLYGGAVADRWGLRHAMIACDLATCLVLVAYLVSARIGTPVIVLLGGLALANGVISAFRLPASGGFPRLFVDDALLARAMSLTGGVLQVARLVGPPLGGLVVAVLAIDGAVWARLVSALVILVVLLLVRPAYETPSMRNSDSAAVEIRKALSSARRAPAIVPLLGAVAFVAGGILPMLSLCVPLAAHQRGWGAGATGVIETAWIAGGLTVSVAVARCGARQRPIGALVLGPVVAAAGALLVAYSPQVPLAAVGAGVMGIGTVVFTSHVFPVYVRATPEGMLARFQALLGVVQAAPILLTNNAFGAIASRFSPTTAIVAVALLSLLAAVVSAASSAVRALRLDT